MHKEHREGWN